MIPTPIALGTIGFLSITVACLSWLLWGGRDPMPLITFIVGVLPSTIGVILLVRQTGGIHQDVKQVKQQTNGRLDSLFGEQNTTLEDQNKMLSDILSRLPDTKENSHDESTNP